MRLAQMNVRNMMRQRVAHRMNMGMSFTALWGILQCAHKAQGCLLVLAQAMVHLAHP
jgi:hypothetical protein